MSAIVATAAAPQLTPPELDFSSPDQAIAKAIDILAHNNCVLLRDALDPFELGAAVGRAYEREDHEYAGMPPEKRDLYEKGLLFADRLQEITRFDVIDWWRRSPLYPFTRAFFLGDPVPYITCARRVQKGAGFSKPANWHMDGDPLNILRLSINVWMPLRDCGPGTGAPGLSLIPATLSEMQDLVGFDPSLAGSDDWANDQLMNSGRFFTKPNWRDDLLPKFGERIWSPVIHRGDALVFTSWNMHGTNLTADMTEGRQSVELRLQEPKPGMVDLSTPDEHIRHARHLSQSAGAYSAPGFH